MGMAHGQNCTGAGIEVSSKLVDGATSISGISAFSAAVSVNHVIDAAELAVPLANGAASANADAHGAFTLNLADPLAGGQKLRIYQAAGAEISCIEATVISPGDLGRIRFYVTAGEVVARDTGFVSNSTLFLSFNVDKNWKWGGKLVMNPASGSLTWVPGVRNRILWNTFFETRLTSVPEAEASSASSLTTFLGSRKSALMQAGNYFPVLINHWAARGTENAMFVAPLAMIGFMAPTDSTTAGSAPVNPQAFYNDYGYGARLGHFELAESANLAPRLVSYLDVICGRFSNLESVINDPGGTRLTRQYRIAIEGVWKVPATPFQIGFSANIGQNLTGASRVQAAPDDLRFFFGARFDASTLLGQIEKWR
jgi:hypothetical protein